MKKILKYLLLFVMIVTPLTIVTGCDLFDKDSSDFTEDDTDSSISNKDTYVLDKIDLYVVKENVGFVAKNVEYYDVEIYSKENSRKHYIGGNSARGAIYGDLFSGLGMIHSADGNAYVRYNEIYPLSFYSSRNEYNRFEKNENVDISIHFTYSCSGAYINGDRIRGEDSYESHLSTEISDFHFVVSGEKTETVVVLDESGSHGYKIYAKLYFVEE